MLYLLQSYIIKEKLISVCPIYLGEEKGEESKEDIAPSFRSRGRGKFVVEKEIQYERERQIDRKVSYVEIVVTKKF